MRETRRRMSPLGLFVGLLMATGLTLAQYVPRNLSENLGSGALPASCTVGDMLFRTDAVAGSNIFGCTATNTWTAIGASTPDWNVLDIGPLVDLPATCDVGDVFICSGTGCKGNVSLEILFCSASNVFTSISIGDPEAGTWSMVDEDIAAGAAAIVLDQGITGSVDRWMLTTNGIIPATDNVGIRLEFSHDGGGTWEATGYKTDYRTDSSSGAGGSGNPTTYLQIETNAGNDTEESGNGYFYIWDLTSASKRKRFFGISIYESGGATTVMLRIAGSWSDTTNAVNAIRIRASSDNISGTGRLYKWILP